jgi:hypothetical protein
LIAEMSGAARAQKSSTAGNAQEEGPIVGT